MTLSPPPNPQAPGAEPAAASPDPAQAPNAPGAGAHAFSAAEREAVYRAIHERRDMRHFAGGRVDDATLQRLLTAAHHAPSVGFMQPWRFIRVRSRERRAAIHALVEQERVLTARALGEREDDFMRLKVEGVLECAELLIVVLPPGREAHVFGRRTLPEMDLASAACAIQNLWLAARAEGLGMGWVSLFDPQALSELLGLPPGSRPIGVLCLGPVPAFYAQPMLAEVGWAQRQPLAALCFDEGWPQPPDPCSQSMATGDVANRDAPATGAAPASGCAPGAEPAPVSAPGRTPAAAPACAPKADAAGTGDRHLRASGTSPTPTPEAMPARPAPTSPTPRPVAAAASGPTPSPDGSPA
ncbi:5,6-dimethylbenzimidazole synthase [Comamonas serinivorans]|uniref:5,6-dimethylbenzimidazole synthase n=1 Tax=Comamonas serinivorans TaxID=1082851 RepID=A0A1Y0EPF4_9BURK|nr:5,6-dimethylbenzimidazole synthase [Comamonas serinivorans]